VPGKHVAEGKLVKIHLNSGAVSESLELELHRQARAIGNSFTVQVNELGERTDPPEDEIRKAE
jgi:ribosomal protein L35AE/L33A